MADLPQDIGEPTVEPGLQGIQVHATPEDFGAGIAQGLTHASSGVEKAWNFYEETSADNATNNWRKKVQEIMYGDPNDPNKPGYYSYKGADAMSHYDETIKALDDAENEARSSLWTAKAKYMFDVDTRRNRSLVEQQLGGYRVQQQQEWGKQTAADTLEQADSLAAQHPEDPVMMGQALDMARGAAIKQAQLTVGNNGFDAQAEIDKAFTRVRLSQFRTLLVTNPEKALDMAKYDANLKDAPNYDAIYHVAQEAAANAVSARTNDQQLAVWGVKADAATSPVNQPKAHTTVPPAQFNDALNKIDPKYRGAAGFVLAGETRAEPDSAGPKGDYHVAGVGQFTADQWQTVTGQKIPAADIGVKGKDPRLDPNASIATLGKELQQNFDRYRGVFGQDPTPGDLALMHQQGAGGAMKLLRALGPHPNDPATNYIAADALTANNIPANATVAQTVRSIEDYYTKGKGGSFGGAGATGSYAGSQSDFLAEHLNDAVNQYHDAISADPVFKDRPDLADQATARFETRYRRQIRDQNTQYLSDMHFIQRLTAGNHFTSWDEVMASSPDAAAVAQRLLWENPVAYHEMDSWFKSNAGGAAKGYGTQFSNVLDRVLAPADDPNRIKDPSEISRMVGMGENALITNTGGGVLTELFNARGKPGGEQDIDQLRAYLAHAKPLIDPLTNSALGTVSPQGQAKYAKFVGSVLPLIASERGQGVPMAEIFKKGGPVNQLLLDNMPSATDQRSWRGKLVHDPDKAPEIKAVNYLKKSIDPTYLETGIKEHTISPAQASQAIRMGARSRQEIKTAWDRMLITREDAEIALAHLGQYHRNFWGQPEQ
jgi:hypothetical protein